MRNAKFEMINDKIAKKEDISFRLLVRWGPPAIHALLRALCGTFRFVHLKENSKIEIQASNFSTPGDPRIYAAWHRDMIMLSRPYSHRNIAIVISRSRDGELGTRIARRMGYYVIRGSSSRGGITALKELITMARNRHNMGFFADGPRGPAGHSKAGVIYLAWKTGAPLVPVAAKANRSIKFRSWDRMVLPLPFSRVFIMEGKPFIVRSDLSREEVMNYSLHLTRRIDALHSALAGKKQS
jgi:lysophospholipid acyltransferase (LPLAT)-like uncharacterized protein